MNKAIAYYRASTISQKHSIMVQKELVRDFCKNNEIELIDEFEEITSGIEKKQIELKKVLDLSKINDYPIICTTIDRLTRDYVFGKKILENYNTIFCSLPNITAQMKLELLGFAEKERQLIKQRTKATLQSMKRNGFKVGNHNAVITPTMIANSIASRKQEARLNENNLKAYNEFKLIREQGKNFSEIAREFNKKGILTSRGKQWQTTQVKRLVKLYNG